MESEEKQSALLMFTSLSKVTRWDTYNIKYQINKEKGTTLLRDVVKSKPFMAHHILQLTIIKSSLHKNY